MGPVGWQRTREAGKGARLTPQLCSALVGPLPLPFPHPNCLGVWVPGGEDSGDGGGEEAQAESRKTQLLGGRSKGQQLPASTPDLGLPRSWAPQNKARASTLFPEGGVGNATTQGPPG